MANIKYQWLKEIAISFGMTIEQFAKTIGYSRQTLYCAGCGACKLHKGHIGIAVHKLIMLSEKIVETDIQAAKDRHEFRRKLIDDFAKRLTEGAEDGN